MLRLTLEIVPFGEEVAKRHIGTLEIARTTMRDNPENYNVCVLAADGELVNLFKVHEHYYADGAWDLCRRAVEILVGVAE